jgi:hypothetical protein
VKLRLCSQRLLCRTLTCRRRQRRLLLRLLQRGADRAVGSSEQKSLCAGGTDLQ